jgi:hypothetical protein
MKRLPFFALWIVCSLALAFACAVFHWNPEGFFRVELAVSLTLIIVSVVLVALVSLAMRSFEPWRWMKEGLKAGFRDYLSILPRRK